ncbi:CBS domain-containing protein [Heliomicrobium modesticaldum]|uniref:CBS domain-containing protein n=1 Tax=Heliomicrobium modesticaldum TaxID=35701 RepID=UPI000309490E|nr:CBS domain-containing protein [Heliomicrobium modesticaldum]
MSSKDLTASEIMSREVYTVYPDTPVADVVKLMIEKRISGVPVISRQGDVIGIISEGDLLFKDKDLRYPSFISLLGGMIYLESPKRFAEEFRKSIALRAEEIMTGDVITVEEEARVSEMAGLMTEQQVNRLPVLRNGKLVGIVTRADILRALVTDFE